MKVFISWSGELSHKVALVLRDWIPSVIQSIEPYVSSENIDKGARWSIDIAKELEASSYGILCITHLNYNAPWLNYEAGALSHAFNKSNVSPFLFNLKRSEIKEGPLLQFQSTIFTKEDIKKLIIGINKACVVSILPEERLNKVFDVWWPSLEEEFNKLQGTTEEKSQQAKASNESIQSSDILEEILELVRTQHKLLRKPGDLFPEDYMVHLLSSSLKNNSFVHPGALRDLRITWRKFKEIVMSHKEDENIPREKIEQHIRRLGMLIEYFLRERTDV